MGPLSQLFAQLFGAAVEGATTGALVKVELESAADDQDNPADRQDLEAPSAPKPGQRGWRAVDGSAGAGEHATVTREAPPQKNKARPPQPQRRRRSVTAADPEAMAASMVDGSEIAAEAGGAEARQRGEAEEGEEGRPEDERCDRQELLWEQCLWVVAAEQPLQGLQDVGAVDLEARREGEAEEAAAQPS